MEIYGYGEDALTFAVLTNNIPQILSRLDDPSGQDLCRIFYRPSFGRRALAGRAEFGEFDAIVSTPRAIYLIEAKWDGASELDENVLRLRPEQVRSHRVLRSYIREWRRGEHANWSAFAGP